MSRTAVALLALAALLSIVQWVWVRAVDHVDLRFMGAHTRHRVHWLVTNSTHIQLVAAVLAVAAAGVQAASILG